MAWEASDWIALASVLVSPIGAVAVVFLTGRQRQAERAETERARTRAESAAVLGPTLVLLNDAEPTRLAFNASSTAWVAAEYERLWRRWDELRPRLGVMATTDPTLSGEATLLIIQIDNTLLKGRMWARDVASGGQRSEEYSEDARDAHAIAMRQASALLGLVWKRAGGVGEMHYPTRPATDNGDA